MLSHLYIGITDFTRAFDFYGSVLETLNLTLKFSEPTKGWAAWMEKGQERPLFIIGRAFNGEVATPGNGQMVALLATNRKAVQDCYESAISKGGVCEGEPGLRPHYHEHYYGAYFRDPEGNKICVCCHDRR